MNLQFDADNPADREKLRTGISRSCRREKNPNAKTARFNFLVSLSGEAFLVRFTLLPHARDTLA